MIDFDLPVTMVGPCGGINFSLYIAQYFMFTMGMREQLAHNF
jgi:hypothetical protein